MSLTVPHKPVLLATCLEALTSGLPQDAWVIDATFGAGGHSRELLGSGVKVLAIDQDPDANRYANDFRGPRFRFLVGNFRQLEELVFAAQIEPIGGILFDLGLSSMQLDEADRGFAFRRDGPLDLRMGGVGPSAAEVVNTASEEELAGLIYRYGEERHSRRIARAIVAARKSDEITTTSQLAEAITRAYPPGRRRDHPARRTFQALRIYVNDELVALQEGLEAARRLLMPGGKLVVISYHSLEDRIVKHFFRAQLELRPLTKKPLVPEPEEIELNPRARSAKLRIAVKETL
ncbi:MAG: 16S rRNA (cytosine(1402)-N(4))-methyltransferase RsmH [Trueperaceae bacterium]|nr:MAG: 16S rRNA (cytosine(1402)-N(4))-methyltransferase RsmH [Trueperaceae bacterium]